MSTKKETIKDFALRLSVALLYVIAAVSFAEGLNFLVNVFTNRLCN